jgi:hypothetical protein
MSGDLITKITLSDGRRLDVNMPTMGDMETLFNGAAPTDNLPYLKYAYHGRHGNALQRSCPYG